MKKIGLMTLNSHMYNYGGILQEYALSTVLQNMGAYVEIIDFDLSTQVYTFSAKRSLLNLSSDDVIPRLINKLPRKSNPIVQACVAKRHGKFDEFRNTYLTLSPRYVSQTIVNVQSEYDALVCGSDQIWNPGFNVPQFFLTFGSPKQQKVIYGASIGRPNLSQRQLKEYQKLMSYPDAISTREQTAKDLLQPYTDKPIHVVLDPTLLLEKKEWEQIMYPQRVISEEYVFCYFLDNKKEKQEYAKRIAEKLGTKIVTLPFLLDKFEKESLEFGDYKLDDVGPQEFLRLIYNAQYILTDSFHATLFSILFRKDFWVFGRNCGTYNMNTRLDTLLSYFNLGDRMVKTDNPMDITPCVYHTDYELYKRTKEYSMQYIKENLGFT